MAGAVSRLHGLWVLCALAFCAFESNAGEDASALEEVLVVGTHPGPGLWKVSKRSHVLFSAAASGSRL